MTPKREAIARLVHSEFELVSMGNLFEFRVADHIIAEHIAPLRSALTTAGERHAKTERDARGRRGEGRMTDLRELLARCEAATGPDRELDLAIAMATRTGSFSRSATFEHLADVMRREDQDGGLYEDSETGLTCVRTRFIEVPPVTSSIDAAVALVEHMQPGSTLSMHLRPDDCSATLREAQHDRLPHAWVEERCDRHLALAIVTAAVRALIAGEEKGRG